MLKQQHQLRVSLLVAVDALVGAGAWVVRREVVEGWYPGIDLWESWVKGPLFLFVVPVVLLVLWAMGTYRPRRDRSMWSEQWSIAKASVTSVAVVIVLLWAVGNQAVTGGEPQALVLGVPMEPGRIQLLSLAVILPLAMGVHRLVIRGLLRHLRRRGWNLRHVAVIGTGRLGQIVTRTLERNRWTGIQVVYFIGHHAQTKRTEMLGRPVRGGLGDVERTLRDHPVDAVYLAIPNAQAALVPEVLQQLERFPVDVRIVPDVHPRFVPQSMVVNELDGMPILSYRENTSQGLGGFSKRVLDIAGSLVGLVLFSPLLLAIAVAIRATSPGPVIFKQRRMSVGNKTFKIYKFRTMFHVEDERHPWQKLKDGWTTPNDPRVTPIGRWLRKTSLDELPQLLNVLKGQMSLVGPRPERPELVVRFREDWRGYMIRQHVKAGMTGWAQVNGLRGQTSLKKRLQYDIFYVRHWSLGFDLRILWLTVLRGFIHRNAY
ncbi:undecaprenyl-phosphate glucose phosphotransferase [Leptolyngbya sp. 15MV]|nr:undecaprenyl-phosphate glucose phosphotransferase [Leptolyngbya sp. 15MV]